MKGCGKRAENARKMNVGDVKVGVVGDSSRPQISCGQCGVQALCLSDVPGEEGVVPLARIMRRKEVYQRGQVLFRPGEPLNGLYVICGGSAKTTVGTEDGRVQVIGFHVPGDLLGLSAMAAGTYASEACALETMSVCKLDVQQLERLADEFPVLRQQLLKIMSQQLRQQEEQMLLLGKRSAEERVAEFLVGLARRLFVRQGTLDQVRLSMSRLDIGNYLGLSEETVSRIFSRFQKEGLVSVDRRDITLNDLSMLGALARLDRAA